MLFPKQQHGPIPTQVVSGCLSLIFRSWGHIGFIDTDLTRSLPILKIASETVAQEIFQAIEQNAYEVLVGKKTSS